MRTEKISLDTPLHTKKVEKRNHRQINFKILPIVRVLGRRGVNFRRVMLIPDQPERSKRVPRKKTRHQPERSKRIPRKKTRNQPERSKRVPRKKTRKATPPQASRDRREGTLEDVTQAMKQ
jgi:hypothetical protein